jgi:AraC-like DNA-binding protein
MEAVGANPQLEWDFKREARDLGISYPHFRRIFRQFGGNSPGHYLIVCRLQRAADRLLLSDDQLGTVAEQLGFSDQFYFSRLFKKYFKLPPLAYRREFRKIGIATVNCD